MNIQFSPMRSDTALELVKTGDTLRINGEVFDFSALPDGATLPREAVRCEVLASDVSRIDDEVHLTLILPLAENAPHSARYPQGVNAQTDGVVPLPLQTISEASS